MTSASESRPTIRIVEVKDGKMIASVGAKTLMLRPLRSRKPDAEVQIPWDAIYTRALIARLEHHLKQKGRR